MTKLIATLFIVLVCSTASARADDEQDRARAALDAGAIQPFGAIEDIVTKRVSGEIIDVELDQDGTQWIYQLKLRDTRGQVLEVEVDATSGEILKMDVDD